MDTPRRVKILVVDDEPDLCWVLEKAVESDGHQIVKAQTGREARRALKEASFDVAFVDVRLPDEDGLKIVQLVRRNHPNTRLVVITGYPDPRVSALAAKKDRGVTLLGKPFDLDQILQIVQETARDEGPT